MFCRWQLLLLLIFPWRLLSFNWWVHFTWATSQSLKLTARQVLLALFLAYFYNIIQGKILGCMKYWSQSIVDENNRNAFSPCKRLCGDYVFFLPCNILWFGWYSHSVKEIYLLLFHILILIFIYQILETLILFAFKIQIFQQL